MKTPGKTSETIGRRAGSTPTLSPSESIAGRARAGAVRHLNELRAENEQLRTLVERQRDEQARLQGEVAALLARSEKNQEEFVLVEEQNSRLASLFVSSARLHETTEPRGVIEAILEIVVNLIGSEEVAVLTTAAGGALRLAGSMGIDRAAFEHIPPSRGIIGQVVATKQKFVREETAPRTTPNEAKLTACVPLVVDDRVLGVVAIFGLLPQKGQLEPADHELLDLLAIQAAIALDYAELRVQRASKERS
jgi:GAF domain-containing protein